ncbi:hypothetical protein ZIOFF_022886 [Zingiber officinale]|uniref:dUTP diphosphatase n=1 Tax=Zingiber officinale TaxID=94328 RepID=A0A8J5LKH7_ZINOF|nr:hypothetical protein ZIOFF_022886 [Zingiber officinale]
MGKEKKEVTFNFLKVKKLIATAKIPERRTEGAAGYNLFIDQDIEIPARDRRLAKTGISIEFPEGHYARVTARSGAAIHLKIDIGVGVIDADYRGEIQLLVINHSNNAISLKAGDSIAQFILEKIITPQIEEVDFLSTTTRGEGSFGSTDTRKEVAFSAPTKSLLNRLYNMEIIFHIPGIPDTKVQAILDTGATKCCICKDALPEGAFEEKNYKVIFGRRNNARTLESQLNPEAELELSQQRRASLVSAETLYSTQWSEPRHRVYQHYSKIRILVTEGQQNLPLINPESYSILRQEGMQLIHLGLVMIRIHALHRRNAGINALVVLRDTRWSDDKSIIGTMEIDLSEGTQLVYIVPNLLISIEDFFHHIELAIQTHEYENWNSAESNLLITRGLIGRLTNTSHAEFRYNIQNVADYLASTRINAVPATPRTTAELQGMRWILQPPLTPQIRNPQAVRTTTLMDGSISLAFSGYQSTGNPKASRFNEKDIKDIHDKEFAGVLINEFPKDIELPPPTGWDDEEDNNELVFPSIWEDTPWEEDPEFDPNDLTPPDLEGQGLNIEEYEDKEDGPETYFLGLQNQETDYPVQAPLHPDQQPINWENSDAESDLYWQQVFQHVEQIEAQLPLANGWYDPTPHDATVEKFLDRIPQEGPESLWYEIYEYPEQNEEQQNPNWVSETSQLTNNIANLNIYQDTEEQEAAHVNIAQLQALEQLEYPILRRLIQNTKEKAFASTSDSAISNYKQPNEPLMGQINYPPAQGTTPQFPDNG